MIGMQRCMRLTVFEILDVKWPKFKPKISDLGISWRYRPQRGEDLSGTDMYHHAKFHADRRHRRRYICNRTEKKQQPYPRWIDSSGWKLTIKEAIHIRKEGQQAHEPWWWGQLSHARIRPLSWHGVFPSCQEPEELSTSFSWWRPLIEVETSSF